jgi:hypothetical protein
MGNIGLEYKSGLGSALRIGSTSSRAGYSYSSQTYYQSYSPKISGVNSTILENEPFIWTYRVFLERSAGVDGTSIGPYSIYRSNTTAIPSAPKLICYLVNTANIFFSIIGVEQSPNVGISISTDNIGNKVSAQKSYNLILYKNEGSFTASSSYRVYINGVNFPITVGNANPTYTTTPVTSITFNEISFGGSVFFGNFFDTAPMYVFNNSVFKVDSGLTTTYIDNLVTQLHRVDNYIHLLPTSYSVNPNNVVYYFPLYLKEGKDIRDYYNPNKKFNVKIGFGNQVDGTFVSTGSANYAAGEPTQTASVYRGPYNIWKKPYPPFDPYI